MKRLIVLIIISMLLYSSISFADRNFDNIIAEKYGQSSVKDMVQKFIQLKITDPTGLTYNDLIKRSGDPAIPPAALLSQANGFKKIAELRKEYENVPSDVRIQVAENNLQTQQNVQRAVNPAYTEKLDYNRFPKLSSVIIIESKTKKLFILTDTKKLSLKWDKTKGWMFLFDDDQTPSIPINSAQPTPDTSELLKNIFNGIKNNHNDYMEGIKVVAANFNSAQKLTTYSSLSIKIKTDSGNNEYYTKVSEPIFVDDLSRLALDYKSMNTEILEIALKDYIETISQGGLDPNFLKALIKVESNWDSNVVSACGAAGLTQFIPETAIRQGLKIKKVDGPNNNQPYAFVNCNQCTAKKRDGQPILVSSCNSCTPNNCDRVNDERFDPLLTIIATVNYLNDIKRQLSNKGIRSDVPELLAAAYYLGPGAITSNNVPREATAYATKFMREYNIYKKEENLA